MPVERMESSRRPVSIALALCAALALVTLAACGEQRVTVTVIATPTPTATPSALSWRTLAMPQGYSPRPEGSSNVGVVRAAAANAAVCVIPAQSGPAIPQVWITQDAGTTWTPSGALTGATPVQSCAIQTDDFDPTIMLLSAGKTATSDGYTLVSVDGGATWQPYATDASILEFATTNGTTYATRQAQSGADQHEHLAVSIDHFQTWQNIDDDIIAANQQLHAFWINPATGDLLAETYDIAPANPPRPHLWKSGDRGAHWTPLADQQLDDFTVQQSGAATGWHVCGATNQGSTRISCTSDGGATWTTIAPPDATRQMLLIGIADDGTLLARTDKSSGSDSVLYVLAPGSSNWTSQGKIPQSFVQYGATVNGTLLWAFPLNGSITDGVGHVYVAQV